MSRNIGMQLPQVGRLVKIWQVALLLASPVGAAGAATRPDSRPPGLEPSDRGRGKHSSQS